MVTTSPDDALLGRARDAIAAVRGGYAEQLAVVTALDERCVAAAQGYKNTGRLLEDLWLIDPAAATRLVRHAAALSPRVSTTGQELPAELPATAAAVDDGTLGPEHVEIIDRTMTRVREIPDLTPDDDTDAERFLAASATQLAPAGLRKVAARLVETLDPDGAAPVDPDEPVDELTASRRRRDGAVRVNALLHGIEGEALLEVLDTLAVPAGPDDDRSRTQRNAEVLNDLVAQALSPTGIAAPTCHDHGDDEPEHDDPSDEPEDDGPWSSGCEDTDEVDTDDGTTDDGTTDEVDTDEVDTDNGTGDGTTANGTTTRSSTRVGRDCSAPGCGTVPMRGRALLTVTMDLDDLTRGVGHGLLDSGLTLSPAEARRLACDAGIVPIILGSRAEPLDIGRLAYTVPDGMRRALHQRDRGCTFPGCTRRPRRCHAHHVVPWLDGGVTALHNLTLLCRYHHHVIHHGGWTIEMIEGRPWYTPPAWIDPRRTPRPGGVDTALVG